MWSTLDATVLQWIYSTISNNLLHTIIEPEAKVVDAWIGLDEETYIFQDNEHFRIVTLQQEFSHTFWRDFPNVSVYCQRLKLLSDQLQKRGRSGNE